MEFAVDLNLIRSQKLLLTPQLKQAIEILEMDSRELFQYVDDQLDTNPALEEASAGSRTCAERCKQLNPLIIFNMPI